MNILRFVIPILIISTCVEVCAQQDSLFNKISSLKGREKIDVLLKIAENTRDYAPELSLEFAEQSLVDATELGDTVLILMALKNLGLTYYGTGSYEKSLEYFNMILKIQQKTADNLGVASTYNNIGIIYDELERYPAALDFYQRSLDLKEKI